MRDCLLGRKKENPDFDFCLKKNAVNFGRKLATEIKAGFVVLDKEHGACRLVKKIKNKACTLDFTDFRGRTLEEDLLLRDFTINAIAAGLGDVLRRPAPDKILIDPSGGSADLKRRIIRLPDKKAFSEDPLRILRAFSFSAALGFKIDREALRLAKTERKKLAQVSSERIRDELFKIFDSPSAACYLAALDKLGIIKIIFPESEKMRRLGQGPYHHLDVWRHTLETVKQLDGLIRQTRKSPRIRDFLDEPISAERKRRALLKLGALLHDIGKPAALRRQGGKIKFYGHERIGLRMSEDICRRLRLSGDEISALKTVVLWHLRPGYLADNPKVSRRAIFRYFRDCGREAVSILLLSIADQRATKGRLTSKEGRIHHERIAFGLIKEYFRRQKEKKMPRLIDGNVIMKKFKLPPSPLIGKILAQIEELQAIGKISTKQAALKKAKTLLVTLWK